MSDNYLNLFRKQNYSPWRWPANWKPNIKHFFRNFKYAYQRAIRGFSDWDAWDLDLFYTHLFRDSLNYFAENTYGYPGNNEFPTIESWQEYLKDIAWHFDQSIEGNEEIKNPYEEEFEKQLFSRDWLKNINQPTEEDKAISKKYFDEEMKIADYRDNHFSIGIDKMKHIFGHLWW
jgi:hypothetical protein